MTSQLNYLQVTGCTEYKVQLVNISKTAWRKDALNDERVWSSETCGNGFRMGLNPLRMEMSDIYCWIFTRGALFCIKLIFFSIRWSNCTGCLCVLWTWSHLGFGFQMLRLYKYSLGGCWIVIFSISDIQSLSTSCMKACYVIKWFLIQVWHLYIFFCFIDSPLPSSRSIARSMCSVVRH